MIPERYMVTAVPIDGGERLCGYVLKAAGMMFISVFGESEPIAIDPDTIKPVSAPVIQKDVQGVIAGKLYTETFCPNCGILLILHTEHCDKCGMALEWEAQ